ARNDRRLTTYDVLGGRATLAEAVRASGVPDLMIVPSSVELAGAEVELVDVPNRENVLRDRLKGALVSWDWVLIDCPPSLGLLTLNALVAAHSVLVPLQCEFYAL